jgi:hypothetical protein
MVNDLQKGGYYGDCLSLQTAPWRCEVSREKLYRTGTAARWQGRSKWRICQQKDALMTKAEALFREEVAGEASKLRWIIPARYKYKSEIGEELKAEMRELQKHLSQQEFRHTLSQICLNTRQNHEKPWFLGGVEYSEDGITQTPSSLK